MADSPTHGPRPAIAVVGAGIGGLSTALALMKAGISVSVFEQAATFGEVGTGISLWPNATRILKKWGILDSIINAGEQVEWFDLHRPDGRLLAAVSMQGFDCPTVCLHRAGLHEALRRPLPPEWLMPGHRLSSLTESSDGGVELRFENGESYHAEAIVGADGINSGVRRKLHGVIPARYRGYSIWRGVTTLPRGLPAGHISETWGSGRRLGIMPIGNGKVCWYATANGAENEFPDLVDHRARVLALVHGWHDPISSLVASTNPADIICSGARDLPFTREWSRGPITLLGDAVHPITPNLGQGSCMAIEDAATLADQLRLHRNPAVAFQGYEGLRRRRTARVSRQARAIGVIGQLDGRILVPCRDFLTAAYLRIPRDMRQNWLYAYRG